MAEEKTEEKTVKKKSVKFYGTGQVWSKEDSKILCGFVGTSFDASGYTLPGSYETEDVKEIRILEELNYSKSFDEAKERLRQNQNAQYENTQKRTKTIKSEEDIKREQK